MDSIIKMSNVHLSLTGGGGAVNILRGIDLQVGQGESVSIVGPSGAGKTTLLMVLAGLERPDTGQITIAGTDITRMGEQALARFRRLELGIVFQSFHLIGTMSAWENVALPLELAGVREANERAAAALDAVGLQARRKHYPSQLSGGEQQRVALARAFVARPSLILADEPTGNLDGETGETIIRLLFELQGEQGTTLVLVTHDPVLAQRCDRTLSMHDGRFVNEMGRDT